jgi:hypothetical protein
MLSFKRCKLTVAEPEEECAKIWESEKHRCGGNSVLGRGRGRRRGSDCDCDCVFGIIVVPPILMIDLTSFLRCVSSIWPLLSATIYCPLLVRRISYRDGSLIEEFDKLMSSLRITIILQNPKLYVIRLSPAFHRMPAPPN